jgi:hypothetical protein
MNPERKTTNRPLRAAALALPLLLVGAGCDDAIDPDPKDTRFSFQASTLDICPVPGGTGEAELIAIVFGPNGDTLANKRVSFETTAGSVDPDSLETDHRGRVRSTVAVARTPSFTVTAWAENVSQPRTLEMSAPAPIGLGGAFVEAGFFEDLDGDGTVEVTRTVVVVSPCHVQEIRFRFSYDPALLAFQELRAFDNLTDFLGDGGTATANDLGGIVEVVLTRDAAVGGSTVRGGVVNATDLVFHGLASGISDFALSDVSLTDPMGTPYDVAIGDVLSAEIIR